MKIFAKITIQRCVAAGDSGFPVETYINIYNINSVSAPLQEKDLTLIEMNDSKHYYTKTSADEVVKLWDKFEEE